MAVTKGTAKRRREQDARAAQLSEERGACAARGPWGYVCTDYPGHDFAHYDSSADASWTDHYEDWPDPLSSHPSGCPCGYGHAWDASLPPRLL